MLLLTFCYEEFFPLKHGFRMFTFSEKPNGISMILEPFCALSQRHAQRDTILQPAPPPRRKFSARVGARPPTPIIEAPNGFAEASEEETENQPLKTPYKTYRFLMVSKTIKNNKNDQKVIFHLDL